MVGTQQKDVSEGGQPALCRLEQKASLQSSAARAISIAGKKRKRCWSGTVVSCRRARHKWNREAARQPVA